MSTSIAGAINMKAFFRLGNLNNLTIVPTIKMAKKSPIYHYLVNINVNMSIAVNTLDII